MQLPGNYLKHGDPNQPLGAIVTAVYRSWAFKQKASIEEFVTDDGACSRPIIPMDLID